MTKDEALKLALEALESLFNGQVDQDRAKHCSDAITALREALAQPQQEPVAWTWVNLNGAAQEIVRNKFLWKKFIDGTTLANDIACWMADFALEHRALPVQPQQEPVAWRVKWPAIGGGYKWLMVDKPLMEKEGFVNEALYTSPPNVPTARASKPLTALRSKTWIILKDSSGSLLFRTQKRLTARCWVRF